MFRKRFNVQGWRYAPLRDDSGGSADNSPSRHGVNGSLGPARTVRLGVSAHPTTWGCACISSRSCRPRAAALHRSDGNDRLHARQSARQPQTWLGCSCHREYLSRRSDTQFLVLCIFQRPVTSRIVASAPDERRRRLRVRKLGKKVKTLATCAPVSCISHRGTFCFFYWICVRKIKIGLTRAERRNKGCGKRRKGWGGGQGGKIVLFTAGPRAPFSPHERGASDEVLIACGHKWFLQTL